MTEEVPLVRPGAALVALLVSSGLLAWSVPQLWKSPPPARPTAEDVIVAHVPEYQPS